MAQNKSKRSFTPNGIRSAAQQPLIGVPIDAPPPMLIGGKKQDAQDGEKGQTGSDRSRVNVSVPPGVYAALDSASVRLGMSLSQVALVAVMNGLPFLTSQVKSISTLSEG